MKAKILILGLICLLMIGCVLPMQKKEIKYWRELFTEPYETIYIFMKDRTFFGFSGQDETKVYMSMPLLEKRLKSFKDENYKIEDIAVIIHNHLKGHTFSPADKKLYWRLKSKKYGFKGRFLLYSHTTNKVYDIEDKKKDLT